MCHIKHDCRYSVDIMLCCVHVLFSLLVLAHVYNFINFIHILCHFGPLLGEQTILNQLIITYAINWFSSNKSKSIIDQIQGPARVT